MSRRDLADWVLVIACVVTIGGTIAYCGSTSAAAQPGGGIGGPSAKRIRPSACDAGTPCQTSPAFYQAATIDTAATSASWARHADFVSGSTSDFCVSFELVPLSTYVWGYTGEYHVITQENGIDVANGWYVGVWPTQLKAEIKDASNAYKTAAINTSSLTTGTTYCVINTAKGDGSAFTISARPAAGGTTIAGTTSGAGTGVINHSAVANDFRIGACTGTTNCWTGTARYQVRKYTARTDLLCTCPQ